MLLTLLSMSPQSSLVLTASQVYAQVKDSVLVVTAYDLKGQAAAFGQRGHAAVRRHHHQLPSGRARGALHRGPGQTSQTSHLESGGPGKDLCLLTAPGLAAKPESQVIKALIQATPSKVSEKLPIYRYFYLVTNRLKCP